MLTRLEHFMIIWKKILVLDMFMKIDESELSSFTSSNSTQICFLHGAKIAVKEVEFTIAGNSLNVCVGSKKLGLDVKLYSETGDDYYSMQLVKELGQMGAGTEYIKHNAGKRIPIHPVMVSKTERTIFSYHENKIYSIVHFFTKTGRFTEKQIVYFIYLIQILFALLIWLI